MAGEKRHVDRGPGALEIWRSKDGSEIAVKAPTWYLNPKITFESLHADFMRNPVLAWRNFGSEVKHNVEAALKDPDTMLDHLDARRQTPWDEVRNTFHGWFRGRPSTRYYIHFDLSKNRDRTGIAMVHREKTGQVAVDFMLAVVPQPGKDINFADLRDRFVYEMTRRGFHVEMVTYDGFQSDETRQVLEEKGYRTDYCSADRNTDAYDTLIELILGGRLSYYSFPIFIAEMEELKLVNGIKYDHPKKNRQGKPGSKDVADAVACSTLTAIRDELDNPKPLPGSIRVHRNTSLLGGRDPRRPYGERSVWG